MVPFAMTFPTLSAAELSPSRPPASTREDDLHLILNTAFVRARAGTPAGSRNLAGELAQASNSPAVSALFSAIRQLAKTQKISELDAAEELIRTFRKLDDIWSAYLHQEGLARITSGE